ncbi:hypothetical protein XENOCAPTIV_020037 [Xenoophorus captivus]|uniref:Uncharacterized protein n=1 Tax=Xenoophorus captivus TaxID=1517983 RepID=A0ABV0RA44_9TELE
MSKMATWETVYLQVFAGESWKTAQVGISYYKPLLFNLQIPISQLTLSVRMSKYPKPGWAVGNELSNRLQKLLHVLLCGSLLGSFFSLLSVFLCNSSNSASNSGYSE